MSNNTIHYDLIIFGAGIVGLSLAAALNKTGLHIGIIDTRKPVATFTSDHFDIRVSAINHTSQQFFTELGIWQLLPRINPYKTMQVWDASTHATINFHSQDIATPDLGHIIENSAMQQALLEKLECADNISFIAPAEVTKFLTTEDYQALYLEDDTEIRSKLLIGADGANSWLRQQSNIELTQHDYEQVALIATVQTQISHQNTAYQIFLPSGPLAFLPLAHANTCSIVWSTSPQQAEQLLQQNELNFAANLTAAFECRLGAVQLISQLMSFPLKTQHVKQYIQPRLALIGDAAHTVHPFAGQGLNIGLADAAFLAMTITQALASNQDFADFSQLRRYERRCQSDNKMRLFALDKLYKLFAIQAKPVSQLRSLGLNLLNRSNWAKEMLMQYALGSKLDLTKF